MRKQFLSLYILIIINAGFAVNIDYGASVDSYVGVNTDLFGYEKISVYTSVQFTEDISFALDGFYKYAYNATSPEDNTSVFDFTTLLATLPVGDLNLTVGRDYMSDYSGEILSHIIDGASVIVPLGFANLIGHVGYTGLINTNEVSFLTTSQDNTSINRLVEGADLVKEFEALTLWASLYTYQDITNFNNLSLYLGGGVNGSITNDIFFSFSSNFQTGRFIYLADITSNVTGTGIAAGMGKLSLTWFINIDNDLVSSLSPFLNVDFGISSGDDALLTTSFGSNQTGADLTGGVTLYSPMTSGGPGKIYSINNQNLTYLKVSASVSPIKDLQTQLGTTIFFRTVEGAISDSDFVADATGKYLGTELSLTGNYRPFSDLGLSLTGGLFFPDGTILVEDVTGLIALYVSLSL